MKIRDHEAREIICDLMISHHLVKLCFSSKENHGILLTSTRVEHTAYKHKMFNTATRSDIANAFACIANVMILQFHVSIIFFFATKDYYFKTACADHHNSLAANCLTICTLEQVNLVTTNTQALL
jgi:hypothetical protein